MERSEFEQFLMLELSEASNVFSDLASQSQVAHAVLSTVAVGGDCIQESVFNMYTGHLEIDREIFYNCLAYFIGMGYLVIDCDCGDDKTGCILGHVVVNEWLEKGAQDRLNTEVNYCITGFRIEQMKLELFYPGC